MFIFPKYKKQIPYEVLWGAEWEGKIFNKGFYCLKERLNQSQVGWFRQCSLYDVFWMVKRLTINCRHTAIVSVATSLDLIYLGRAVAVHYSKTIMATIHAQGFYHYWCFCKATYIIKIGRRRGTQKLMFLLGTESKKKLKWWDANFRWLAALKGHQVLEWVYLFTSGRIHGQHIL